MISLARPPLGLFLELVLIVDTFFDLHPKCPNIKQALIILISPSFCTQLFAKRCIFGSNFFVPEFSPAALEFRGPSAR